MLDDPSCLGPVDAARLVDWANAQARTLGFKDWIDAYHQPIDRRRDVEVDVIHLVNTYEGELHLLVERSGGAGSYPFCIQNKGGETLAEGSLSTELDEEGDFADSLTSMVIACVSDGGFHSVTEYDSLVARTNPGVIYR